MKFYEKIFTYILLSSLMIIPEQILNSQTISDSSINVQNQKQLERRKIKQLIYNIGRDHFSRKHSIDSKLFYSIALIESNLNPIAIGDSGKAFGLFQIHLSTAQHHYDKDITVEQLMEPIVNIHCAAHVLKDYIKRYDDDWTLAIACYNVGPVEIDKYYDFKKKKRIRYPKNISYVLSIFEMALKIDDFSK